MPEYLAPGVFVEEVSFHSKSIEGVPTSTTGFAGMVRYGPTCYPGGPRNCEPRLITSFVELERVYGGLDPLLVRATALDPEEERISYLAQAARAFFDNGGKRLYVSRVFAPLDPLVSTLASWGVASRTIAVGATNAVWTARWPGRAGNVYVETQVMRSKNIAFVDSGGAVQTPRAKNGAVVEVFAPPLPPATGPTGNAPVATADLRVVRVDANGVKEFIRSDGTVANPAPTDIVQLIELLVRVQVDAERLDEYAELSASPVQVRYVGRILEQDDPADEDAIVYLNWDPDAFGTPAFAAAALVQALQANPGRLTGGHDGLLAMPDDLAGRETSLDDPELKATGLAALGEIDDIAIVALPDSGTYLDPLLCRQAAER